MQHRNQIAVNHKIIPELVSGSSTHAFTLIELLVVVLIIGILAAVAVPQYQKAVLSSRFTQAKIFTKSLADAVRVYYMEQGSWPTSLEQLSVDITARSTYSSSTIAHFSWGYCYLACNGQCGGCWMYDSSGNKTIAYWDENFQTQLRECIVLDGVSSIYTNFCQKETGKQTGTHSSNGFTYYLYK